MMLGDVFSLKSGDSVLRGVVLQNYVGKAQSGQKFLHSNLSPTAVERQSIVTKRAKEHHIYSRNRHDDLHSDDSSEDDEEEQNLFEMRRQCKKASLQSSSRIVSAKVLIDTPHQVNWESKECPALIPTSSFASPCRPCQESTTNSPLSQLSPARAFHLILIRDFDFDQHEIDAHVGDTVEFRLSSTVPLHAEHDLYGESDSAVLQFSSQLLQVEECRSFRMTLQTGGLLTVRCRVFRDMACLIRVFQIPVGDAMLGVSRSLMTPTTVSSFDTVAASTQLSPWSAQQARCYDDDDSFFDSDDEVSLSTRSSDPLSVNSSVSEIGETAAAEDDFAALSELLTQSQEQCRAHSESILRDEIGSPIGEQRLLSHRDVRIHTVVVDDQSFRPATVRCRVGDAVRFVAFQGIDQTNLRSADDDDDSAIDRPMLLECCGEFEHEPLSFARPVFVHRFVRAGAFVVRQQVFSFLSCTISVHDCLSPLKQEVKATPRLFGSFPSLSVATSTCARPVFHRSVSEHCGLPITAAHSDMGLSQSDREEDRKEDNVAASVSDVHSESPQTELSAGDDRLAEHTAVFADSGSSNSKKKISKTTRKRINRRQRERSGTSEVLGLVVTTAVVTTPSANGDLTTSACEAPTPAVHVPAKDNPQSPLQKAYLEAAGDLSVDFDSNDEADMSEVIAAECGAQEQSVPLDCAAQSAQGQFVDFQTYAKGTMLLETYRPIVPMPDTASLLLCDEVQDLCSSEQSCSASSVCSIALSDCSLDERHEEQAIRCQSPLANDPFEQEDRFESMGQTNTAVPTTAAGSRSQALLSILGIASADTSHFTGSLSSDEDDSSDFRQSFSPQIDVEEVFFAAFFEQRVSVVTNMIKQGQQDSLPSGKNVPVIHWKCDRRPTPSKSQFKKVTKSPI